MFKDRNETVRSQAAGIRRSAAKSSTENETSLYWKRPRTYTFGEVFGLYQKEEYLKAIPALQSFLKTETNLKLKKEDSQWHP